MKSDAVYLAHMLECIEQIQGYVADGKERFMRSPLIQDACVRKLQVMMESSQRISERVKNDHPDLPWREMAGFRNVLTHDYFDIDPEVVWGVIEQKLPVIREQVSALLRDVRERGGEG